MSLFDGDFQTELNKFLVFKQKVSEGGSSEVVPFNFFHWTQFHFKMSHD